LADFLGKSRALFFFLNKFDHSQVITKNYAMSHFLTIIRVVSKPFPNPQKKQSPSYDRSYKIREQLNGELDNHRFSLSLTKDQRKKNVKGQRGQV